MFTVLVCDDDIAILDSVEIYLKLEGYNVLRAENGRAALEQVKNNEVHCVILDIMMPGLDGLQATLKLREKHNIPIILLSAKSEDTDKITGLSFGADDYVVKPFGMAELVARIRARLRRTGAKADADTLKCGGLTIDRRAHKAFVDGIEMPLTLKEYDLLLLLMENSGAAFTREQLLERIWDMAYDGGTRTVDVHVQTLRTKMGRCGHMIETVRGVGYRFGGSDAGGRASSPTNESKSSDLPSVASTRRKEGDGRV